MARTTEIDPGTLLQQLASDVLQEIPDANFAPGVLTQLWSLHANQAEQRNVAELALELNPDYNGPRRLIGVGDPRQAKLKEEERRRQESLRLYEETMRTVRERSELLTQRIDERLRADRRKLQETEDRALRLHDGRAAYVGTNGTYLDGEGRRLEGKDLREAEDLHRQYPDAPTWEQKDAMEHQIDALKRLKEKSQHLRDDAKGDDGQSLSDNDRSAKCRDAQKKLGDYEKEFNSLSDDRAAALATSKSQVTDDTYGGADYAAAYARGTSYAGSLDNSQGKSLSASFKPAAAGQGAEAPSTDLSGAAPSQTAPSRQLPSR